jgi:hypothetical protein
MEQMSFAEFAASIACEPKPPAELSAALSALWHDGKGDWSLAHTFAQEEHGSSGAWVHGYLHRKEGDLENAAYWYSRAGRSLPPDNVALGEEWEHISRELLGGPVAA